MQSPAPEEPPPPDGLQLSMETDQPTDSPPDSPPDSPSHMEVDTESPLVSAESHTDMAVPGTGERDRERGSTRRDRGRGREIGRAHV